MERELVVGGNLRGVLTTTDEVPQLGLVALHPSSSPSLDFPLLRHLARALPAIGVAVLRFDRRPPAEPDADVPLWAQTEDAIAAIDALRGATSADLPVVAWGFSQGGWVGMILAHEIELAGLVAVGASGVSPADQMRYASARALHDAGFGDAAVAEMLAVRRLWERSLQGDDSEAASRALDRASHEPWFPHAWLPRNVELPIQDDFEFAFDPAPLIRTLPCPLLVVVGDDDRWVPLHESTEVFKCAPQVEFLHVPGGGHAPTHDGDGCGPPLPGYEDGLARWLTRRLVRRRPVHPPGGFT